VLEPNGLKSSIAVVHRLMTSPRIVVSLAPTVMQRFGALVPSISIWRTELRPPVAFVFGELPGCV
jgi:hypothetical protein